MMAGRSENGTMTRRKPYVELVVSGLVSASLYLLLFLYETEIMQIYTRTDTFYPALPIITAFAFSFAHGAFAGYFWEVVGIKAKRKG